ncbi:hypothetical protein [Lentibacillus saliphilus]|uniref:hypothetical protein n=1 Tax=Lentibacillus saliphilus TaxID=2737028 RepID=UPI001C30E8D5|nr:hypothetical protein [Lentibacillus saliphilus]
MRQIKGIMYFFITGARYNFTIFWAILLSTMFVSLLIAYFVGEMSHDMTMVFAVSAAVYIYCSIMGYSTVKEAIPHLLKLGATRKNLFIGLGASFLCLAFLKAVLTSGVHVVVTWLTDMFQIDGYQLIHPAELIGNTLINRIVIDTAVMFFILASMFVLGLLFYKFGLLGGGIVISALVITFLVGLAAGTIPDIAIKLYETRALMQFVWLFLIGFGLYAVSWSMLRHITIVKTR